MKRTSRILATAALVCGLAAGGLGTVAEAKPQQDVRSARASYSVDVDAYWTAERMENAKPADQLVSDNKASKQAPKAARKVTKGPKRSGSQPLPTQSTIGKVFFTLGGSNYVCSGNSVTAGNRSIVATAGHCLNEGPGAFATNWIFVPAYENGNAPYGRWSARELHTSEAWAAQGDITYDVGFAVMGTDASGRKLADVVGSTGIEFGASRGLSYNAFGYPAAFPYTGETLHGCSGVASDDSRMPGTTQGIPCTMTGGSSGGPWFLANGNQNSVNSYGYKNISIMYGPYYGDVAYEVYDTAARS